MRLENSQKLNHFLIPNFLELVNLLNVWFEVFEKVLIQVDLVRKLFDQILLDYLLDIFAA